MQKDIGIKWLNEKKVTLCTKCWCQLNIKGKCPNASVTQVQNWRVIATQKYLRKIQRCSLQIVNVREKSKISWVRNVKTLKISKRQEQTLFDWGLKG